VPEGSLVHVLISEGRRRSVGYLSHYEFDESNVSYLDAQGTVFFVGIDNGKGGTFVYAVTAGHCVNGYPSDEELYIEIQGNAPTKTLRKEWLVSKLSDVACRQVTEKLPVRWIPITDFIESKDFTTLRAGHNVYIVGLFSGLSHRLDNREIEPVVRFGRVANPWVETPVFLNHAKRDPETDTTRIRAHLIESISFGGESGSPVFFYKQHIRTRKRLRNSRYDLTPPVFESQIEEHEIETPLLGLVSSTWQLATEVRKGTRGKKLGEVGLNSGIAVIAYANDIEDLLMNEKLTDVRSSTPKRNRVPTPLSKNREDGGITQDEFIEKLKRVSRRIQPSQPDEGKSKT
jgi:hypothetical protein